MGRQRQMASGGILAIFYLLLVFGSLIAAFAEGGDSINRQVYAVPTTTEILIQAPPITPVPSLKLSLTPNPSPSNCHPPEGWTVITILAGDTLNSLAELYQSTPENLKKANCLLNQTINAGTIFYIPSAQTPCRKPQPEYQIMAS